MYADNVIGVIQLNIHRFFYSCNLIVNRSDCWHCSSFSDDLNRSALTHHTS